MSELSPAAQAVLDAASNRWIDVDDDIPAQVAAATLCAAAEHCKCDDGKGYWIYRPNILAIASELEAQ
jgi:hypothetical protein